MCAWMFLHNNLYGKSLDSKSSQKKVNNFYSLQFTGCVGDFSNFLIILFSKMIENEAVASKKTFFLFLSVH